MATVYHETENAILYFYLRDVREYLEYHAPEYGVDEGTTLMSFLSSIVAESIKYRTSMVTSVPSPWSSSVRVRDQYTARYAVKPSIRINLNQQ